jgi:zinc/manganese transport system ATP-binding protein
MKNGNNQAIILMENVQVDLGGMPVIKDITLGIQPGEFVVILGPNGAGKTTLLKLLLGLIRPIRGLVQVFGEPPRRGNPLIGYTPQHRHIEPDLPLRACDLVGFGLDGHRWGFNLSGKTRRGRILQALNEVNALALADAPVGHLSGGEQQRLLIAQALLTNPRLLLLDEPLANLDLAHQQEIVSMIARVCHSSGVTVLLVSHDINPLLQFTDRVLFLAGGHGVIGSPDKVINSQALSQLYGSTVDVVHARGRYFVIGAEI